MIVILTKEEARADVVEDEKVFELVSDGQLSFYIHPCFIIAILVGHGLESWPATAALGRFW